jgi:hypothetical protein
MPMLVKKRYGMAHALMAARVTFAWRCHRLPDVLSTQ